MLFGLVCFTSGFPLPYCPSLLPPCCVPDWLENCTYPLFSPSLKVGTGPCSLSCTTFGTRIKTSERAFSLRIKISERALSLRIKISERAFSGSCFELRHQCYTGAIENRRHLCSTMSLRLLAVWEWPLLAGVRASQSPLAPGITLKDNLHDWGVLGTPSTSVSKWNSKISGTQNLLTGSSDYRGK